MVEVVLILIVIILMGNIFYNNKKYIEELNIKIKRFEENLINIKMENEKLNKIVEDKENIILNLSSKINKLVKQLSFYTEIKTDSMNLNVDSKDEFSKTENSNFQTSTPDESNSYLNAEKSEIYNLMENTNYNLFITGKAGTGKSYLLKYFKMKTRKRVLYTAPTGIAALNIGGVTIHSAFGFRNLVEDNAVYLSSNMISMFRNFDTLVIDEISMVRVDIFHKIDLILREANNNEKPFGGKQIILLGDIFQLPPVANKEEVKFLTDKYGGIFFFNYPEYYNSNFIFKELNEVFRQTDIKFIDILNKFREGKVSNSDIKLLNDHYTNNLPRRVIQVVPTKREASIVNTKEINEIKSKEYVYNANILVGKENCKETDFPCNFKLKLKVGSLVMMIVNDQEHRRWVNGTLGIVSKLTDTMIKIAIDGTEYEINQYIFEKYNCEYNQEKETIDYKVETSVSQYPIILAYAITIHKSQGMTYQQIAVNIEKCFAPGQAYVALSRCANFDKLFLTKKISPSCIITNNSVFNFYNFYKNELSVL